MNARRRSMSPAFIFVSLCAALVLMLSARPVSGARHDDNDQGEDGRGSAIDAEDDDNQVDDDAQGCTSSADCPSGQTCSDGECCFGVQRACTLSADCCAPAVCNKLPDQVSGFCCIPTGGACSINFDCCSMVCETTCF